MPGDHLDDSADRIGAEQRALGAAHDLHALDPACRERREVVAAAERVGLDAVHHHQRVIRLAAAREDRGHAAEAAVARHGETRHRAQGVGHRLDLLRPQFGLGDHRDRTGRARERHLDLRGRDDHRFGHRAHVERRVHDDVLAGQDDDVDGIGPEAVGYDPQLVASGRHVLEAELAAGVGFGRAHDSQGVREHYAGVRDAGACRVRDGAAHRGGWQVGHRRDAGSGQGRASGSYQEDDKEKEAPGRARGPRGEWHVSVLRRRSRRTPARSVVKDPREE